MKNNLKREGNANCDTTIVIKKLPNVNEWNDIGEISGIYKIVNIINGKYYVGSSKNIKNRWKRHNKDLNKGCHRNNYLQRAWNKYGERNFEFVIVEVVNLNKLDEIEQKYLDVGKSEKDKIYNNSFLANRIEMNDEIKNKLSILAKKRFLENGSPIKGRPISKERKELLKKFSSHPRERNGKYDHTSYTFYNELTKEYFIGTKFQFRENFKIDRSFVWMLLTNKVKSTKGWKLV